jgi:uncharacterized protein YdgA (DUF945 family)
MNGLTLGTFFALGCLFVGTGYIISKLIESSIDKQVEKEVKKRTLTSEEGEKKNEN